MRAAGVGGHVTHYDVHGQPTSTVETGTGVSRTSTTAYDKAGRQVPAGVVAAGPEAGQPVPATRTTYQAGTGLVESTGLAAGGGSTTDGTGMIGRACDAFGRLTGYTDGTGTTTHTDYDSAGRLLRQGNRFGSRTLGYDLGVEPAGAPVSATVSNVGTLTVGYGADGTVVTEQLPGGLNALTVTDAAGEPVSLSYGTGVPGAGRAEWLRSTASVSPFGQVQEYGTLAATGTGPGLGGSAGVSARFGYDGIGRLTSAVDRPAGGAGSCTRT